MSANMRLHQINEGIKKAVDAYSKNEYWQALDEALDALCHPYDNASVQNIIMKIETIDLLYKANLIQFLPRKENSEDKRVYYSTKIAKSIVDLDLDHSFSRLYKKADHLNPDLVGDVIRIHSDFSKAVINVTGRAADVFASKYLHFCQSRYFPILDSFAEDSVITIMKLKSENGKSVIQDRFGYDDIEERYDWFCRGVLAIQEALVKAGFQQYKLRDLDKYLWDELSFPAV